MTADPPRRPDPVGLSDAPTLPASTGAGGPDSRPPPIDPRGDVLAEAGFDARYRPGDSLGRGGMGEVRRCLDGRIGREVAMKVMRAGTGSQPDVLQRFVREARVQGQLEHPGIVPVYDLGIGPDGAPFFTMKRLRGMTLERILAGLRQDDVELIERTSRRKLLAAFADVCQAVEFAHSRGVLHRDLKPANIMLGDFGEVYVLDWGVAKLAGAGPDLAAGSGPAPGAGAGGSEAAQTAAGAVLGTPGYMAPEQLQGRGDELDARADVYALGAILFEILTLQPLHDRSQGAAVIESTLRGADARLSVRAPDRPAAPELEAICVRATALEPAARFASVRELHAEVERYLDGDRDLEKRRQLAAGHAETAAREAETALGCGAEGARARARALREAGQALALDPTNATAVRTLTRLMLQPPAEIPPEVKRAVAESGRETGRIQAIIGASAYLGWLGMVPLFALMGVRQWLLGSVLIAMVLLIGAIAYFGARARDPRPAYFLAAAALSAVCLALGTRLFGPLVMVPELVAATTIMFLLRSDARPVLVTALGLGAIAVPMVLEWTGVLAASYTFRDGQMAILPQMTDLPPRATMAALFTATAGTVLVGALSVRRVRRALDEAEQRLQLQAWHLRQLVPDDARGAVAAPPVVALTPKEACACPIDRYFSRT